MPGFAPALNDAQAADLVSFVRQSFGAAEAVTPGQVAALRKAP